MKTTNKHNIADVFFRALTHDDYTRGDAKYSNTNLIAPAKSIILKRAHAKELTCDVTELFARWRGTCIHDNLERFAKPNSIAEERLEAEVDGVKLSTKPDHYDGDTCILDDYKTTSVWSFMLGLKQEWVQQLNIGAWFLRQYGFEVKGLKIQAALWDWNRNEMMRNEDYPKTPLHSLEVPLWSEDKQLEFIRERLAILEECEAEFIASGIISRQCTPEERWETATKFAVMKGANKRATKLCDSTGQAAAYIKGHKDGGKMSVVERPGEAKRCSLGYCDASPWCQQWKSESVLQ